MSTRPNVLLVDDDERFRTRLSRALRERGIEVQEASNADEAIAIAQNDSPEWAVVDLRMPGMGGLELISTLLQLDATTRVVVLTGYGSVATAVEALRAGAFHYLQKPITVRELLAVMEEKSASADDSKDMENAATKLEELPSLARAEWEYIHRVLQDCDNNLSEAARRLRMHRRSLQRKLQKYPPTL